MKVNPRLWERTNLADPLNIFTGKIAEEMRDIPVDQLGGIQRGIAHVFRRWYFLRLSPTEHMTPAGRLEYLAEVEGWPASGQFLISPTLTLSRAKADDAAKARVELDVSFINFWEQPLLVDLVGTLEGQPPRYFGGDTVYERILTDASKAFTASGRKNASVTRQSRRPPLARLWASIKYSVLSAWMDEDPFIADSFSLEQLGAMLESWMLRCIKEKTSWLDSEVITDQIVRGVRRRFPHWGYNSEELHRIHHDGWKSRPKSRERNLAFLQLGDNLDRFVLTPLSWYLQLVSPYYGEIDTWNRDLRELVQHPDADPIATCTAPPSALSLTSFGETLLERWR